MDLFERLRSWGQSMKGQRMVGLPGPLEDDLRSAADEIERLRAERTAMRAVLQDIWDDGMQDRLSDDLRNRVEHCLGITSVVEQRGET